MIDYSLTSHTHPYLPLSGGTVTGTTYFTQGLSASTLSGNGSKITGLGHNSLTGLSNNDHPQYSLTGHTHNYLPLSGGTVTGQTNFTAGLSANSISANKFHLSQINGTSVFNSVTAYNSTYTNLPIYSGLLRTQQINEQTIAAQNADSSAQEYCGQINTFNSSLTGFTPVPGFDIITDKNFTNYNILNTRGHHIAYGNALELFDAAIYGKTNVEANGGGAGGQFIINANNNQSPYKPYNSAVKGVFSGATNVGSGSTVGYVGYGFSSNSTAGITGSSVGVCGYATKAGAAWTIGVIGIPYISFIDNKTWGLVGIGHSGTFGGSLFSGNKISTNVHPYEFQQVSLNNPVHFTYNDEGCLHVAATAEVLGPMWVDGQFSTSAAVVKGTQLVSTTSYQTTSTNHVLFVIPVGGGSTITLQTSDCINGREIIIKDTNGSAGTDNITIETQGSETIDGAATYTINSNYGKVTLISNGTNWFTL